MPSSKLSITVLFTLLSFLFLPIYAQEEDNCPSADEIVYSPFRPWFDFYNGTSQMCWKTASCLFTKADEARKQQFAATALVMGLVPLTLKDIAWPERRLVPVSKDLAFIVETIVLALGLQPVLIKKSEECKDDARSAASRSSLFARWAWSLRKRMVVALICVAAVLLLASYAALAVAEIYSKRVALGCPFPVFVLMWYLCGLVPGCIHAGLSRLRRKWTAGWEPLNGKDWSEEGRSSDYGDGTAVKVVDASDRPAHQSEEPASSVQGAEEWWVVQLVWAIYYIAGTLIFTSVMAVTVVELFVWVMIGFAVTGASKLLAFFLCLVFEDNPW